jgi:hypothetical protein
VINLAAKLIAGIKKIQNKKNMNKRLYKIIFCFTFVEYDSRKGLSREIQKDK